MNEKRYFKVFCSHHIIGSQNKYVVLFDLISKYKKIDTAIIKETYSYHNYSTKNISSDINYLNKILLRSLNEFNYDKTCDLKTKKNLISIEILFFKGLYNECLALIKKTKKINKKNENKTLMLDLLNWEKKCLGYSKGFSSAMAINKNLDAYFIGIKEDKLIIDLYYQSYAIKNSINNIHIDKLKTQFNQLLKNPLLKKRASSLNSTKYQVFYQLIYANYFNIIKKPTKELLHFEKALKIFNTQKVYRTENPLDYISIYNRILDIIKFENNTVFKKRIKDLRAFSKKLNFQKNVAEERIYFHTHKAELEHYIYYNIEEAFILMQKTKKAIEDNKYTIEPYYFIALYYLFAVIHCKLGDYSGGLKFINAILNEYKLKERPSIYIKAELLNIIIHFELNNYSHVLTNINNIKKKYFKVYNLNFTEKKIIEILQNIASNPKESSRKKEFNLLNKQLELISDFEQVTSNHFYIYYISNF